MRKRRIPWKFVHARVRSLGEHLLTQVACSATFDTIEVEVDSENDRSS